MKMSPHIIKKKKSYSMASSFKLTLVQQPYISQQQETKFTAKTSESAQVGLISRASAQPSNDIEGEYKWMPR